MLKNFFRFTLYSLLLVLILELLFLFSLHNRNITTIAKQAPTPMPTIVVTEHKGKIVKIQKSYKPSQEVDPSYKWLFMIVTESYDTEKKGNLYLHFDKEELSNLTVKKQGQNNIKMSYADLKVGQMIIYTETFDCLKMKQNYTISVI